MAISDFESAAHLDTSDPRANLWEGFTYAKLGDYQQALRAYGDAIAASDRFTPAYYNRGLSYMMMGNYKKAIADFNDAIRLEPANAEYYFKRGLAYEQMGDHQKASESFSAAIEFDKNHAGAHRHMADVLTKTGPQRTGDPIPPKSRPARAAKKIPIARPTGFAGRAMLVARAAERKHADADDGMPPAILHELAIPVVTHHNR